VITSAAMIMVSVFLAFVVNGDPTVKQFGLGMAVAVDATVVRCVLVPAIINPAGPVPAKGERESTAAGRSVCLNPGDLPDYLVLVRTASV
jgi:hypothetical protein